MQKDNCQVNNMLLLKCQLLFCLSGVPAHHHQGPLLSVPATLCQDPYTPGLTTYKDWLQVIFSHFYFVALGKRDIRTLCSWVILLAFLSADFFQNHLFRKIISGIQSEYQTVWIQIRPDILSGLIWIQTVCKGYL